MYLFFFNVRAWCWHAIGTSFQFWHPEPWRTEHSREYQFGKHGSLPAFWHPNSHIGFNFRTMVWYVIWKIAICVAVDVAFVWFYEFFNLYYPHWLIPFSSLLDQLSCHLGLAVDTLPLLSPQLGYVWQGVGTLHQVLRRVKQEVQNFTSGICCSLHFFGWLDNNFNSTGLNDTMCSALRGDLSCFIFSVHLMDWSFGLLFLVKCVWYQHIGGLCRQQLPMMHCNPGIVFYDLQCIVGLKDRCRLVTVCLTPDHTFACFAGVGSIVFHNSPVGVFFFSEQWQALYASNSMIPVHFQPFLCPQ